ncbi:hypothetical protein GCM10018953_22990 [Streptosporangium nondiastaticum]
MSRTGPAASVSSGCRACGSHLTQSHWAIHSLLAHTMIRMSSGEWNTVICAIIARTSSRTATGSPVRLIRAKECRATATGSPATVECARTNLRSAPEVSASRSSTGRESGGTSWTASFCTPVPSRTVPKSSSRGRRSHSRWLIATHHSESGAGPLHSSASRCWTAARRARLRICDR